MKATGEVMKYLHQLRGCANEGNPLAGAECLWSGAQQCYRDMPAETLRKELLRVDSRRIFVIAEALRRNVSVEDIHEYTKIDPWFIDKIKILVEMEQQLHRDWLTPDILREAKRLEYPDRVIAELSGKSEEEILQMRKDNGIVAAYQDGRYLCGRV